MIKAMTYGTIVNRDLFATTKVEIYTITDVLLLAR